MKIGIDAQTTLGEKTGFGFYVKNLLENLQKIDPENQYIAFRPQDQKDLSTSKRFLWDQFSMPKQAKLAQVDILHQPCFSAPVLFRGKIVVTIHDIIAKTYGQDLPFFSRQFFGRWMPFTYRFADRVICDSECTKKDIIRLLKIPAEKIKVIYLAATDSGRKKDLKKIKQIKEKYSLGEKYFLHIGSLNPRKNLEFLLRVFSKISQQNPKYNLVIAGGKSWYHDKLNNLAKELGLEKRVIFTGYVPDNDIDDLYFGASIFLFPSLYEGFGLPPLEAMSRGIPVISSDSSSLPEVIGNGGLMCPPDDETSWIKAIESVINNVSLQEKLSRQGLVQAKKFSWKKCAEETLHIYKQLYKDNK